MQVSHSSCASDVVMIELVTAAHTIDGAGLMDVKPLLMLMDICTCSAAEKHTGVNCVTVSMGDVVFEHFPKCGEMLELTARPVYCGNTSLDISLSVVAEEDGGSIRRRVCDAIFTYVTTRGPKGEKRFCPPLRKITGPSTLGDAQHTSEQSDWERTMAKHRRSLVRVEQTQSSCHLNTMAEAKDDESLAGFDLEISEVVLPAHQNHMGHTFGGVVMAWMAKAALAKAARKSRRSPGSLLVRSVLRVSFQCGSGVSDHLIFRPRVNAIFDEGRSAEVEVRVSKKSIMTGVETCMNVGYFYVSGSNVGTGNDIPFASSPNHEMARSSSSQEELLQQKSQGEAAEWRRRLLLARRRLLGGYGDAVEWHPSLFNQAPILTIYSVLRLVHHNDHCVFWRELPTVTSSVCSHNVVSNAEWTAGEAWGQSDTFVLRVKGVLSLPSKNGKLATLLDVLQTLKSQRPEWDKFCNGIEILEAQEQQEKDTDTALPKKGENAGIQWDVVQHIARTPAIFIYCSQKAGIPAPAVVPFCYLRTWKVDAAEGTAILASQSVLHSKAKTASSIKPSGWFISCAADGGTVELTYIVEHNLTTVRRLASGMSDEKIVETMAGLAKEWFVGLSTLLESDCDEKKCLD